MHSRLALQIAGIALAVSAFPSSPASAAEGVYAVTTMNELVFFGSDSPDQIASTVAISGLQPGENVLGIDFRPALPEGRLYLLGSTSRLYVMTDLASGLATEVGAGPFSTPLNGTEFGFDFNPTVDRIRIVSNANQNLRLHPDTGAVAATDPNVAFAAADVNFGADPSTVGSGYINSIPAPPSTLLYNIDSSLDILVTQNPANDGTLNTVGPLGVDASDVAGFDISGPTGVAYAALEVGGGSSLYTIDLASGDASFVGSLGTMSSVRCISVYGDAPPPVPTEETSWGKIKSEYRSN